MIKNAQKCSKMLKNAQILHIHPLKRKLNKFFLSSKMRYPLRNKINNTIG